LFNNNFKFNLNVLTNLYHSEMFKMSSCSWNVGMEMRAQLVSDVINNAVCSTPALTSVRCCIKSLTWQGVA